MKILLVLILLTLSSLTTAQSTSFVQLFAGVRDKDPIEIIELTNKDLIIISIENSGININVHSKLYFLNERGHLKDSLVFIDSIRSLKIFRLIPTNYGYCLLGEMMENNRSYFWNAKLDAQFKIVSQQFTASSGISVIAINFTVTKDSGIAVIIPLVLPRNFSVPISYNTAKLSKDGVLLIYNNSLPFYSLPVSIFERKDSSGYILLDDYQWITTDSLFNTVSRKNLSLIYNGVYFNPNFQPSGIKKNDSTYFYAGRWLEFNGRRNRDLVFLVLNTSGQSKFVRTIVAQGDTSFRQAVVKCIDTTRDGRFIYWGGTYNFDYVNPAYSLSRSPFILTKLDLNYQIVWQKKFGSDAYCPLEGVLATSDGGCVMYGRRYDYNNTPKIDGYIIKVDGNGLVTSETSIPIPYQQTITTYPNPSNGQLNFKKEAPSVSSRFDVNIFDISGKLVFQKRETDLTETFDLSHLSEGNYMYQITSENAIVAVGKWVKSKIRDSSV